ncbi:hypothetical protein [Salipaludibacillus sp. CF4.18]|uniref:hypothetical protein n=1 Tax=Salipaludibacillus sp. CF4.18 TaxID=3373081 RepID=UPI003EE68C94
MERMNRKSSFHFNVNTEQYNFALSYEFNTEVKKFDVFVLGNGMVSMEVNQIFEVKGDPDLEWHEKQDEKGHEIAELMYKEFINSDLYKLNEDKIRKPYSIYDDVKEKENLNSLFEKWMLKHADKFVFIK